jgi:drug/metabolite transporter (DMT)-like permease
MNEARPTFAPHLVLLLIQLMFGVFPVMGKVVLQTVPPFALVGFRIGITAAILLTVQRLRGDLHPLKKRDYWTFFILSFFGVSLNQMFFVGGLSLTKASNTSILAVTIPIFALIMATIVGAEKLRVIKVFGIFLAALGVIVLIDPRKASFSSETTLGDILIILNSLCYGIFVVISKEIFVRNGAVKSTAWIFGFASLICVPLGAFSLSGANLSEIPPLTWAMVLQIAVISTTLPYMLIAWSLARVNPSTVAVYVYLQPLIGLTMAVIFLDEHFTLWTILAAALIFAGVFFVSKKVKELKEFEE